MKNIQIALGHGMKKGLSRNPAISMEFIEQHIDKPWEWGWQGLSKNPAITMEFIERNIDKYWCWDLRIGGLSSNPAITMEFIENHLTKPWLLGNIWFIK